MSIYRFRRRATSVAFPPPSRSPSRRCCHSPGSPATSPSPSLSPSHHHHHHQDQCDITSIKFASNDQSKVSFGKYLLTRVIYFQDEQMGDFVTSSTRWAGDLLITLCTVLKILKCKSIHLILCMNLIKYEYKKDILKEISKRNIEMQVNLLYIVHDPKVYSGTDPMTYKHCQRHNGPRVLTPYLE